MSNAEPMADKRRREAYAAQARTTPYGSGWWPTPRQARRMIHKERKGKWGFGYPDTKGYATYPRARAIRERLENRRQAEARRGHAGDPDADDGPFLFEDEDDYLSYLPVGRVEDMLRYPDNRHLY
jgi:hypothetical protein